MLTEEELENLKFVKKEALENIPEGELQIVPDGIFLRLILQNGAVDIQRFILGKDQEPASEDLHLQDTETQHLMIGSDLLLYPSEFYQLEGQAYQGIVEYYTLPIMYFNKKFNAHNGLGQMHSEVAYFIGHYLPLLPNYNSKTLKVLDLGCGRGRNTLPLSKYELKETTGLITFEPRFDILGIDYSESSLSILDEMIEQDELKNFHTMNTDLNQWRESYPHDLMMAIVSLQFLDGDKAKDLLRHCMQEANLGALHLLVFPIKSSHPEVVWPAGFGFLPESDEVKYEYMKGGWSLLEYRESYGHLGRGGDNGLPIRGLFATLIAQKTRS